MTFKERLLLSCAAVAASTALAQTAHAQASAAPGATIEELVVTAEKREQSLQEVPVAITAFSGERREVLGINNAQDLTNFTPGLSYNTGNDRLTMRGIGRLTNNRSSEGGVAMYNDNFYTSSVYSFSKSSLFIDRTEVLRGPQGTLYGRNAIGGAMNIISRRPTDDFYAEARAGVANYNTQQFEAAASGAILGDALRGRIAGSYFNQHKGFYHNVAGGPSEGGRGEVWDVEYQLDGKLGDGVFDWWFKGERSKTDALGRGAGGRQGITVGLPNTATSLVAGATPSSAWAYFNRTTPLASTICDTCFEADTPNVIKIDSETFTLQANLHLSGMDVRYVGGRTWYHYQLTTDVDGTANSTPFTIFPTTPGAPGTATGSGQIIPTAGATFYPRLTNQYDEEPLWFSNELNFASTGDGPMQWLVGLYQYREESNYTPTDARVADDPRFEHPLAPNGAPTAAFNPTRSYAIGTSKTRSNSYAAFGQVDWSITPEWVLHTGLRYTYDKKTVVEGARLLCYMAASPACPAAVERGLGLPIDFTSLAVGTGAQIDPSVITPVFTDPVTGLRSRVLQNSWEGWGGTLGLDWKPDADTLVYAKYSRGYKAGGFNSATTTLSPLVTTKKETINAYEVGAKKTFFRQFQANVSAYYYDYRDLQAVMSAFDPLLNTNTNLYANLPKASIKGVEVETIWQPIRNLQILANYSYLDSKIKEACCFQDPEDPNGVQPDANVAERQASGAALQDLKGAELSGATPHRVSLNGNYTWNFSSGDLTASLNYSWRSRTYYSVFNRYYNKANAYDQTDIRLLWNSSDKRYTVIGYVKNLTNNRGEVVMGGTRLVNTGPNFGYVNQNISFIQPRIYGAEVQYRF